MHVAFLRALRATHPSLLGKGPLAQNMSTQEAIRVSILWSHISVFNYCANVSLMGQRSCQVSSATAKSSIHTDGGQFLETKLDPWLEGARPDQAKHKTKTRSM